MTRIELLGRRFFAKVHIVSSPNRRQVWLSLLLLGFCTTARAELVLTNFSASKPLKIMPIGDSITDDCSLNGAWRLYLQPMLDTNGVPFTFVGRQISSPAVGFNKTHHEGYCGAVIAPPGVFAVHGYSTTDAYLLKIVADAMLITNNRPDLVLLLIGANDIGRGRNPYVVATNDMSNLLNLIFSYVPNANIVISKITSLQNAGLNYAPYATNVIIYNAALQSLANQRRAAGQNVFLADMFTAVDYNTMFMSDHVHPNALGLNAMAKEFFSRIQAITLRTNQFTTTLIHGGDSWRYLDTGEDPGTNWAQLNYDDSGWNSGNARFGYSDLDIISQISFGTDAANKFMTTYFRRSFVIPWNLGVTNLNFRTARADGAAVWLNGQELFRTNLPSGPLTYTNTALNSMTGFTSHIYYPTNIPITDSLKGTNQVAIELHLNSVTNVSAGFDMELFASGNLIPPPSLSIAQSGGSFILSWPVTNSDEFTLYTSSNLDAAAWSISTAAAQTNASQIIVTQSLDSSTRFFRLQRP
jgi:lysophospholipase L1-like esterase